MAIQPCRECGQDVSTEAVSCPHCGVPRPVPITKPPEPPARLTGRDMRAAAAIAALLIFGMVMLIALTPPDAKIYERCVAEVTARLKAPTTAHFAGRRDPGVVVDTSGGGHNARVLGWVDAQNGFGAQVRSPFACYMTRGTDGWVVVSVDIGSP